MGDIEGVLHAYAYGIYRATMVSVEKLENPKDWITRLWTEELAAVSV